jgi:hypothetical protein
MTDNWDFYPVRIDGKPASIYLDLGAAETAPVARLPYLGHLRLFMNAPREDGLSSREEFDTLSAIEDHVRARLAGEDADYVGRCTGDGSRDFYFYLADSAQWNERVDLCMRDWPAYRYECGSEHQPGWEAYFEFLYPEPIDRERIDSRRVCIALEKRGDKLTEAREIDHWAYFADSAARDAYLAAAAAQGYVERIPPAGALAAKKDAAVEQGEPQSEDAEESDPAYRYCAHVWRVDIPSYAGIDAVILPLYRLAAEHGGRYDGWETVVVTG